MNCMFYDNGRCKSMYAKGIKCDGIEVPKKCPYKVEVTENAE